MTLFKSIGHLLRLSRAGYILLKEGAFVSVEALILPAPLRSLAAGIRLLHRPFRSRKLSSQLDHRLAYALVRLGPSYIKLGQFLATRPDVVGAPMAAQLSLLQDRVAAFPQAQAIETIESAFNKKIADIFLSFSAPIAAASMAQVHKAELRQPWEGRRHVAVKILRPGIRRLFLRDLGDMYFAASWAEYLFPHLARLRPVEVVDTLARSVMIEMDFRLEAAAASEFFENVQDDPIFRIPKVFWDWTSREVLTLEWIEGIPLSDPAKLRAAGFEVAPLGQKLVQTFLKHAVGNGFFHADMHPGNLFIDESGTIVAVDFGLMGRLTKQERRFLAEILYGFIQRDYHRVAAVHFEAGYVPSEERLEDFAQALRAVGEPIHSRSADQISMAKLLALLFEITELFNMKTRPELLLLQKTMVVVEGVGRQLDPQLNLWEVARPIMKKWIEENLGLKVKMQEGGAVLPKLWESIVLLPDLLLRLEKMTREREEQQGLPCSAGETSSPKMEQRILRLYLMCWALFILVGLIIIYRL